MIAAKTSMHIGRKWNRKHNLRQFDKDKWNKDNHIDYGRSEMNEVLADTPLDKFFDATFGDALVAYNEKEFEKHPDRLIGFKNRQDYEKCSEIKRRERAVKAYRNEQKKNVQEGIFQLGDHEEYLQLVEQLGQKKADEVHKQYLTELYKKFVKDNPSLRVVSAVIHMDEIKDGTPHLHLDFLPVAESNRGLTTKVSMEGALKTLGFKREKGQKYAETPYKQWLSNRREGFENFAQTFSNEHKLGIVILPSEKSTNPHIDPPVHKEQQQRIKASNGKIKTAIDRVLKGKSIEQETAEYIIANAQATSEGITQEAVKKQKKADEDMSAAKQVTTAAEQERERANALKKKTDDERAELNEERTAFEAERAGKRAEINRRVRHRLSAEKLHKDMSKVSAAQRRRMAQIGVTLDENGLTVPKR